MALTFHGSSLVEVTATGTHSTTFDVGTNPSVIGIWVLGAGSGTLESDGVFSVGGVQVYKRALGAELGNRVYLFDTLNPAAMSGVQTVQVIYSSYGGAFNFLGFSIDGAGGGATSRSDLFASGTAGFRANPTIDSLTVAKMALLGQAGGSIADLIVDNTYIVNDAVNSRYASHEDTGLTGSREFGFEGSGSEGWVEVAYDSGDISETPDAGQVVITAPAPGITGPGDIFEQAETNHIVIDAPVPTVSVPTPKVIPLVGESTEMPGRVPRPSGLTTPVLGHPVANPEWVDLSTLVAARTRLVPLATTGASGDPELVWDDDDDLVMTEYYE